MTFEKRVSIVALVVTFVMLAIGFDFLRKGNLPSAMSAAGGVLFFALVGGWPQHFAKLLRKPALEALRETQSMPWPIAIGEYAALALTIGGWLWSWLAK